LHWLIGILIFLTYEFKIVLALASWLRLIGILIFLADRLIGILIFLTYEFKIVLALASCIYFDKLLLENRHHFLRMKIPNYLKMDTIIRLRQ